jgi:hypothetical protein
MDLNWRPFMPSILGLVCFAPLILALTMLVRWEYQRTRVDGGIKRQHS